MRIERPILVGLALVGVLLTGCGGNGVSLPTVAPTATVNAAATSTRTAELAQLATAQAPTATPLPTNTPVPPTATPAPTATATPLATATRASASATPRPTTQAASSRAPLGAAPAGWKRYEGSPRVPFALYYPPDWKVDASQATTAGRIKFESPDPTVFFWMQANTQQTTVSIDTLRAAQAKAIASSCKASGVEGTSSETYSDVVFDELLQTCDTGQPPLLVFGIAVGLNNGYPWSFYLSSPRDSIKESVDTYFQPMLDSLHIYADPVG